MTELQEKIDSLHDQLEKTTKNFQDEQNDLVGVCYYRFIVSLVCLIHFSIAGLLYCLSKIGSKNIEIMNFCLFVLCLLIFNIGFFSKLIL